MLVFIFNFNYPTLLHLAFFFLVVCDESNKSISIILLYMLGSKMLNMVPTAH